MLAMMPEFFLLMRRPPPPAVPPLQIPDDVAFDAFARCAMPPAAPLLLLLPPIL